MILGTSSPEVIHVLDTADLIVNGAAMLLAALVSMAYKPNECDSRYQFSGSDTCTRYCRPDGKWSGNAPSCLGKYGI